MNEDFIMSIPEDDDDFTCNQLLGKLAEISAAAHYVYALWSGLPKSNFYIRRIFDLTTGKNVEDDENNKFSLKEFIKKSLSFNPKDPVFLIFRLVDKEGKNVDPEYNYLFYGEYMDEFSLSLDAVENDTKEFLKVYCEKCLRQNQPFTLTPELIQRFGFTSEDVRVLKPMLARFNASAKKRIRKEFDALAALDFIRETL